MSVLTLSQQNFEAEVENSKGIVLVDFWATWCGPCKMFAPIIDEIASENLPDLKVGKVDVDENQDLAGKFKVMSIPTVGFFKDGKLAATSVGVKSKKEILDMIEKLK
ncbi:thioredoxin [Clostridium sp. HBUAS56010]|uniref:thioredoxin n=1 Tax=Clostridium sp. HBUAS56010 TaxID=2571127 RepID=UPI0011777951|nr:thioredoxin [Clostridium sp. HBUAS56010]